jgi:hypothetical protein
MMMTMMRRRRSRIRSCTVMMREGEFFKAGAHQAWCCSKGPGTVEEQSLLGDLVQQFPGRGAAQPSLQEIALIFEGMASRAVEGHFSPAPGNIAAVACSKVCHIFSGG